MSEHVSEILFELSFLEDNACVWTFSKRQITINNETFPLVAHKPTGAVRRIVLQENTVVPPRCQATILAKTIYCDLSSNAEEWASKPSELLPGVQLARTLIADQANNVQLRVIQWQTAAVHIRIMR